MSHPRTAIKVAFKPFNMSKFYYYVWQAGGKWFWEALGNNGVEPTQEEAMEKARRWIRGEK
jgi:hypothetical protein